MLQKQDLLFQFVFRDIALKSEVEFCSLTEQLEGLRDSFDDHKTSVLTSFVESKKVRTSLVLS